MYVSIYNWKPHLSKEEMGNLMAQYAEIGEMSSAIAHYVRADATGGMMISKEIPEYAQSLAFSPYVQWQIVPVHEVSEILPVV